MVYTDELFSCFLSGVDVQAAIAYLGIKQASKTAAGAGTFVIAYGCHKVFAPVRLAITATATPVIVRYLRQLGWMRKPLPASDNAVQSGTQSFNR